MTDEEKTVVEALVGQTPTSYPNEVLNNISETMHWPTEKTDKFVKHLEETGLVIRQKDGFKALPEGEKLQKVKFWWVRGTQS